MHDVRTLALVTRARHDFAQHRACFRSTCGRRGRELHIDQRADRMRVLPATEHFETNRVVCGRRGVYEEVKRREVWLREDVKITIAIDIGDGDAIRIDTVTETNRRRSIVEWETTFVQEEIVGLVEHGHDEGVLITIVVGVKDHRSPTGRVARHARNIRGFRVAPRRIREKQRVPLTRVGTVDIDVAIHIDVAREDAHRIDCDTRTVVRF